MDQQQLISILSSAVGKVGDFKRDDILQMIQRKRIKWSFLVRDHALQERMGIVPGIIKEAYHGVLNIEDADLPLDIVVARIIQDSYTYHVLLMIEEGELRARFEDMNIVDITFFGPTLDTGYPPYWRPLQIFFEAIAKSVRKSAELKEVRNGPPSAEMTQKALRFLIEGNIK